jgi:hypothetical protein
MDKLEWIPYDKKTVPRDELLLFKLDDDHKIYHTGKFSPNGVGVIGGVFYFDLNIVAYAHIKDIL